jgi:hypothetical protein
VLITACTDSGGFFIFLGLATFSCSRIMLTLQQALRRHPLPRLEARMLLQHVRPGLTHARMIADPGSAADEAETSQFEQLALRRLQGEPMAYLLGEREFYGRNFPGQPGGVDSPPGNRTSGRGCIRTAGAGIGASG